MECPEKTGTALILTCERDRPLAELCSAGITKYWTGVSPLVVMDTDRSTETDLPDDVRDMVRRVPYMRRTFDLPYLSPTEQIYILDSDNLVYGDPVDFGPAAYQASMRASDDSIGLDIWKELGITFPTTSPRFCGGMFSCEASMFKDGRDLAIAYARICMRRGVDETKWPGVICEQSLQAGLWRSKYPDCPLDPGRYPLINPTDEMVIYHISCAKDRPLGQEVIRKYEASL